MFTEFKKHAKKQNITVNSLVNKLMKEYVEWGAQIPSINLIPISASLIGLFLKSHNEEEIRKVAKEHAEIHMVENLLMLKNEESIEAFLSGVLQDDVEDGGPLGEGPVLHDDGMLGLSDRLGDLVLHSLSQHGLW